MTVRDLPIGIIQGRLTKSPDGRLQYFPKDKWREEFKIARQIGLDAIEPILLAENYEENPLLNKILLVEMKELARAADLNILSVCADFLVDHPFHKGNPNDRHLAGSILSEVINNCRALGAKTIVIPLLGAAEVASDQEKNNLRTALTPFLDKAKEAGIVLALESSLPAKELKELIESFNHPNIKICYDVGNATSFGLNVPEEIASLDGLIREVHLKDRKKGGASVPMGTGDTDFYKAFMALDKINYKDHFILEAARGSDDLVIDNTIKNLNFVRRVMES